MKIETIREKTEFMEKIGDFFVKNIEIVTGCFKLNDMIESPIISIEELELSIKNSSLKWNILNLYTKECNLTESAYARDTEIVNCLIEFVQSGYNAGNKTTISNTDNDMLDNEIEIIANRSLECKLFQLLTPPQKRIIKTVVAMATCEISKGIRDIIVKKSL